MDSVAVTIDASTALATITFTALEPWSATVTEHANAAGMPTYRLTTSDGTYTTYQARLAAIIALLDLISFVVQIES